MTLQGAKVGVIGAGRSGIAAARLLKRLGAEVLVSDSRPEKFELPSGIQSESGGHSRRLLDCQLIIRSPGVSSHLPIFREIHRHKIPVWSELELGSRYLKSSQLIAITGTNGKTTTTTLVGELFRRSGKPTQVGGNIGTPLSELALRSPRSSAIVSEVSSYQLEDIQEFHPTLSAILNITPDHLEHHGSMRAYIQAKARIFENQNRQDVCVLNADDPWCRKLARTCRARVFWFSRRKALKSGISYLDGHVIVRWKGRRLTWSLKTQLPGPHNIENILASVGLAVAGGIPLAVIRSTLVRFKGVEHRLENVRTFKGARYVNDSKATNVDSTRVALDSFEEPLVLIMGGEGKGAPYRPLRNAIQAKARALVLIGEDAPVIAREFKNRVPIIHAKAMPRAVQQAARIAQPGDVVLLSPACASFDQYNNYEERGRHFKGLVQKLG